MVRTLRLSLWLVSASLLASVGWGCKLKAVDGGDGAGGSGAAAEGAGGAGGSGGGSSECQDKAPDCLSCRTCAAQGPCKVLVDACLDDPGCAGIDQCLGVCGIDPECEESCYAQYYASLEVYSAARACLDCAVCPSLCSGQTVCE